MVVYHLLYTMDALTRKQFFSRVGGIAASLSTPLTGRARSQTAGRPKNVLLLMSDQHKPDAFGAAGDPVARTPNLDALAGSGLQFDNAYCSNPVCVPSRASLLTGLYTHNHKTYNNRTPWPFENKTMAHAFSEAGYMTALVGKMHFVDAQTHGFDYRLGFNDWFQYLGPKTKLYADELGQPNSGSGLPQIDDLWRDEGDPWAGIRDLDNRKGPVHVGRISKLTEEDHFESFVARESIRFLKNHGNKPFFLVSSFLKPHDPFMPAGRFANMFKPEDMKLPDTFGKVDVSTVPREIRDWIQKGRSTPELLDPGMARRRIAFYYASIAQMDDAAGRVLKALRELGLENDTVVIYTSDHGDMLGEHGLWHKFVFYESSVRIPLIFRVPGLTSAGARSEALISQVQMFPTLAELCGLSTPPGLDAESFVASLRNPARTPDATVFAEYNLGTPRAKYMVRQGDFKYIHYVNDIDELYNLRQDPKEMRNLALLSGHRDKVEGMKQKLFAWYRPPEGH
jgi:choline-sulfatase